MTVHLAGVSYALGEPRRLSDLTAAEAPPERIAALGTERAGFRYCLVSEAPILELAGRAVSETLAVAGQDPQGIDAVVFASDSFGVGPEQRRALGRFLRQLGLTRAYPLNVALSECAGSISAIRLAAALVDRGEVRNALLVSVDCARFATPGTRVIGDGLAVVSDGAASALISAVPLDGFEIEGLAWVASPALFEPGDDPRAELRARVELHRQLFRELLGRHGLGPVDIERVFPNNFTRPVLQVFLDECGFRREQIWFDNISRIGHCLGSDCLINLRDYAAHHECDARRRFVLLSAGQAQLAAALIRPSAISFVAQ